MRSPAVSSQTVRLLERGWLSTAGYRLLDSSGCRAANRAADLVARVFVEVLDVVTLASMGFYLTQNFIFAVSVCFPTAVVVPGVLAAEAVIAARATVSGLRAGAGFTGVLCHQ